jgi:hypothetical protein
LPKFESERIAFSDDPEKSGNGIFKKDDAAGEALARRSIQFEEVALECPR